MQTPKCYYSYSESADNDINNWSVIVDGQPICSKRTFPEAVRCAESFKLNPCLYFWNGYIKRFQLLNMKEVKA